MEPQRPFPTFGSSSFPSTPPPRKGRLPTGLPASLPLSPNSTASSDSGHSSYDPLELKRRTSPPTIPLPEPPQSSGSTQRAGHEDSGDRGEIGGDRRAPSRTTSDWAQPEGQPKLSETMIPNLPHLAPTSGELTALPNWDVAQEVEFTISKLLGEPSLDDLMKDKHAQSHFREYVETLPDSNPVLVDFLNDIKVFSDLTSKVRAACEAIEDVYLVKSGPNRIELPISIRGPILECLRRSADVGLSIAAPQQELLASLYAKEFQMYMQTKLVEHAVSRLKAWRLNPQDRDGLADCYCLTNPRLRDHPIVLASDGFAQLTGYPLDAIIGRNCRFLQGPGTAPESVRRLREALNNDLGSTSLLLNYRRNGEPFFNLLCMLPLKDVQGRVKYFLGGQIDVTGNISTLLGTDSDPTSSHRPTRAIFTPAVQARAASASKKHSSPPTLEIRREASRSSLASASSGNAGAQGTLSPLSAGNARRVGKKASRGNDLGLTVEEHAAINNQEPFASKMVEFEATYSRVVLFRSSTREILFVTPEVLLFCELPTSIANQLPGVDFVKVLAGATKDESERMRRKIKLAVEKGHSYSLPVGLRPQGRSKFFGKKEALARACVVHLTPLMDKEGNCEAFVALWVKSD